MAAARDDPGRGDPLVKEYVRLHSANSYVLYRNRYMWAILDGVVRHPEQDWVRDRAQETLVGALAGSGPGFVGGLALIVLALQALAGDTEARGRSAQIVGEPLQRPSPWSTCEAPTGGLTASGGSASSRKSKCACSTARPPSTSRTLRRTWRRVWPGTSRPPPTLAESLLVIGAPWNEISDALDAALTSAHNVQDPVYCARTSARVNAMRRWWRADLRGTTDPIEAALRLATKPEDPRHGALHVVGEEYGRRSSSRSVIVLPTHFREANTLATLAEVVHQRPAAEFSRLNSGIDVRSPLPIGQSVMVPVRFGPA